MMSHEQSSSSPNWEERTLWSYYLLFFPKLVVSWPIDRIDELSYLRNGRSMTWIKVENERTLTIFIHSLTIVHKNEHDVTSLRVRISSASEQTLVCLHSRGRGRAVWTLLLCSCVHGHLPLTHGLRFLPAAARRPPSSALRAPAGGPSPEGSSPYRRATGSPAGTPAPGPGASGSRTCTAASADSPRRSTCTQTLTQSVS